MKFTNSIEKCYFRYLIATRLHRGEENSSKSEKILKRKTFKYKNSLIVKVMDKNESYM
ncbi:hypothetical protein Phum_PHUM299680 [Pediculus humanus corporis]|uniref:Uncharacterized protein n=1 Tax=Pediculus humanus subsp. corporis TaxID=121224 RepID=E0VM26_PEDHC|nr:uncharacterized protein Phum_PHUM299680 [Pediculus humanus corporis]EEB14432.1 hypothetical protein Phum_PHUM299680 [Pediculus humanus corporis]